MIQLFSKDFPRLQRASGGENERPDAERRASFSADVAARALCTDRRALLLADAKALRLGQAYVDSAQFPRMVRPIVEYIASRTEEHASVGVIDEDELVYIARSKHTPFNSTSVRLGAGANILHRRRATLAGFAAGRRVRGDSATYQA